MDIGGHLEYAKANRERLDAKITELRAEGWDVVARRERDLALSERDDARDDLEGAVATLTSVRVWAEIVGSRHSDEHVRRHIRMLLGLLDGKDPDTFGGSSP